jgi:hypothetical protein
VPKKKRTQKDFDLATLKNFEQLKQVAAQASELAEFKDLVYKFKVDVHALTLEIHFPVYDLAQYVSTPFAFLSLTLGIFFQNVGVYSRFLPSLSLLSFSLLTLPRGPVGNTINVPESWEEMVKLRNFVPVRILLEFEPEKELTFKISGIKVYQNCAGIPQNLTFLPRMWRREELKGGRTEKMKREIEKTNTS